LEREHQRMIEEAMDANLAAEFWSAVEDCLMRFHNCEASTAREKTHTLWERLRYTPQPDAFRDMIYHEEPWYIACNLAGREDVKLRPEESALYRTILTRHRLAPKEDSESMMAGI